jgi:hypothetical protein
VNVSTEKTTPVEVGSNLGLGAGAEARKPTALLNWGLHVDCPKCGESNDLASSPHDTEHYIAGHIFSNTWDKLDDWEVTCEHCDHEFTIGRVEY